MGNIVDRIGDFIVTQGGLRRRSSDSDESTSGGYTYTYPTKNGASFFSPHFIMGGERFETYQPEAFLFGENLDLNFLGSKPTAFPYAAPLANEPTRSLRSLLNIRKESIRLIRVTDPDLIPKPEPNHDHAIVISKDPEECKKSSRVTDAPAAIQPQEKEAYHYNIEFVFDSDVMCSIRIYYFCHEEVTASGITYVPKDWNICSDKVVFARGAAQSFSQSRHIFTPSNHHDCDLMYSAFDEAGFFDPKIPFPIAIQMSALEGPEPRQSHTLIAIIERNNNGSYSLKPFVQKLFIDGLSYLMQEIYGIENKTISTNAVTGCNNKYMSPEEEDECNSASECVVCLSDPRDTLILPCRHLCLCYACADSLRYQANNCPICRAPFRALLQIRAVRIRSHDNRLTSPQSMDASSSSSPVPPGYESLPLIEALNGPFPMSRDRLPPDIDRTPVSVRRSHHRRHKHSSSHHHSHDHRQDQQLQQQQPHRIQPQQVHLQSFNKVTQNALPAAGSLTEEAIPLPTRRVIPTTTAPVVVSPSEKIPPEPAPMDWKLLPGSRMHRKQSDEETSSSASSGIIPQETTRLLNEPSEPVEFLQRSASTKSRSTKAGSSTGATGSSHSPKLMIHNYAVIHAADRDLMIPSETAASSLSSLPSPNDSMTADGMTGSDDDHDDGRGDVDAICQDFSRVLREIKVTDSNASQFDMSTLRLATAESEESSDLDKTSLTDSAS